MKWKNKFFLIGAYLAFLVCLLPVTWFTYKHPAFNFDMLGYMAIVTRMNGTHDLDQVHAITYATARRELPADTYEKLTTNPPFRKEFETNGARFKKILPIYVVKPLYTTACYLFFKAGIPLTIATVMPSLVAFLLIGLFVFFWLGRHLSFFPAFFGGLLLMYSLFTVGVMSLSTPDCVSAFFILVAAYFILERPHPVAMFVFMVLAAAARVDNVVTAFLLISFLVFGKWKRLTMRQYLVMIGLLGAAYLLIIFPVTRFGWNIFYYSQYARHIDFSKDFDQPVSLHDYLSLVWNKLVTTIVSAQFTFFMFLTLLLAFTPFRTSPGSRSFDQAFLLLMAGIILFRFLLLPDLSDRFYLGFYLIICMVLARRLSTATLNPSNAA